MKSLKQIWEIFDDRTKVSNIWKHTAGHPVPPGTGWWYVFGSATLAAFILQVVTGIALATMYTPSTESAYSSLEYISHQATLGHLLRGLHYFGASAMIFLIGIHVSRTYLMGSYKYPREMNWITGAVLLALVVAMGFTGQLLRWDQIAVWSVYIAAEQAGRVPFVGRAIAHLILAGSHVGGQTLTRFFAFHVFFFPALIFAFLGFHLYLVICNGISEPPKAGHPVDPKTYRSWYEALLKREGRPFWPYAAWRDVLFGAGMITALVILAWLIGAPHLSRPPSTTILKAEPRPDWYLLWYYALLALSPHVIESYLMVLLPLSFGLLLILLPVLGNRGERSAWRRPWAILITLSFWTMIGTLWISGKKAPWSPDFSAQPLPASVVRATSGPVYQGSLLFHSAGCEACHQIAGHGGHRGPDLTYVGDRLTADEIRIRIVNGATNMPAFGGILNADELSNLVAFLESRTTH